MLLAAARLLLPMRLQLLQRHRLTLRQRELFSAEKRPVHRESPLLPLLLPLLLLDRRSLVPRRPIRAALSRVDALFC
jgi:hypothetical protein